MENDGSRQRLILRATLAAFRSRAARGLAGLAAVLILGVPLGLKYLADRALSDTCEVRPIPDLSMAQIIALKRRKDAWQKSPDLEAALDLGPDEITALLAGETAYAVYLSAVGTTADALIAVPAEGGGCYNVRFQGSLAVRNGVAELVPSSLSVGGLDLSALAGTRISVTPAWLERWDHTAAGHLANTEAMTIQDGQLRLRLYDRYRVW